MQLVRFTSWFLAATMLVTSGCCAPICMSGRHGEPTCEARNEMPCGLAHHQLRGGGEWLRGKCATLHHHFDKWIEPPAMDAPKPPHSRFHPLPTQPVFMARNGDPFQNDELIPVPVADADDPFAKPNTSTWRDLPSIKPKPTTLPPKEFPQALPQPQPALQPPQPMPPQPEIEESPRGALMPTAYHVRDPNPLRPLTK